MRQKDRCTQERRDKENNSNEIHKPEKQIEGEVKKVKNTKIQKEEKDKLTQKQRDRGSYCNRETKKNHTDRVTEEGRK